jgi:hypothetical protein
VYLAVVSEDFEGDLESLLFHISSVMAVDFGGLVVVDPENLACLDCLIPVDFKRGLYSTLQRPAYDSLLAADPASRVWPWGKSASLF